MKRIMVIGISPGVGKSTFARRLGEALQIKVFHLDAYFWKPNWVEASLEEFSDAQTKMVQQDSWIIEGNYNKTIDIRLKYADTIMYLELPRYVCLYRVVKRFFKNVGRTRPDIGEGCKEKIDWDFIKFIYTTYYPRKKRMAEKLKELSLTKQVVILKSKQEIQAYLDTMKRKDSK